MKNKNEYNVKRRLSGGSRKYINDKRNSKSNFSTYMWYVWENTVGTGFVESVIDA